MRHNDTVRVTQRLELDAAESDHTARMRDVMAGAIRAAGGWLSFERFMDLALYAPGLGYYSGGAQKLGKDGDFTTAPEASVLFGACVAAQCAEIYSHLGGGYLLEIGAGSGRLAVDILQRLEQTGSLPRQYWILEVSADLRQRQRLAIEFRVPHLIERVVWLDQPPAAPFDGVIVANEVLDALPVRRFVWHPDRVEEIGVVAEGADFDWQTRPATPAVANFTNQLAASGGAWDDGYVSEYCPRLGAWTRAVTHSLRSGAVLWFDYGLPRAQYYLPERHEGTLLCHFRHRAHSDPFHCPGLQDITAWVDFTLLAEASLDAGFELAGFTTQAHFLAGLAIDAEMRRIAGDDENTFARLANQARQLMLPGEMGERFKAMAWQRGFDVQLSGFRLRDLRHSL